MNKKQYCLDEFFFLKREKKVKTETETEREKLDSDVKL